MTGTIEIPVELEPRFDIYSLLILLGIFQGLFLTFFFLNRTNRKKLPNVFVGLFVLILSIITSEIWLSYTGYLLKAIWINNYSEPFNFLIGPFFYFYLKTSIKPEFSKKEWWHFFLFAFYLVYFLFYFLQPWQEKYNSFVYSYHPELEYLPYERTIPLDPLGVRAFVNQATFIHIIFYGILGIGIVKNEFKKKNIGFWKKGAAQLAWYRAFILHYLAVLLIFLFVKLFFGRDFGDYFIASYITITIYSLSFHIVKKSIFFKQESNLHESKKYLKSSLSDVDKELILKKIEQYFHEEKYYLNNLASLPGLAKQIGESQHHVSQVINEKLNQSFFELLADYRIEEAKNILLDLNNNITIEEIAERVGYNSKSAFNKAFKKKTGKTPSEFRR